VQNDVYAGKGGAKLEETTQRHLSLSYTSLAGVLLALRSSALQPGCKPFEQPHVPWRDAPLTQACFPAGRSLLPSLT